MSLRAQIAATFVFAAFASTVQAADLIYVYRAAFERDPVLLMARAKTEAVRENLPQARAGLLPNLSYSASRSRNSTEQTVQDSTRPPFEYDYTAESRALSIRQPLFRMQNYFQYRQTESQVFAAEATLEKETQDVAIRASIAYFGVLLANERLRVAEAQITQYREQLKLAERSFAVGVGTRNDVEDAKARSDLASAQEIDARNNLTVAERALAAVIGEKLPVTKMLALDSKRLLQLMPPVGTMEDWLAQSEENNHEVTSLRYALEAAEQDVSKARSGHYPTLDLVASKSFSSSESNSTIGNEYRTTAVGVQLNIPIFSGGATSAVVRQALANRDAARHQLDSARRQIEIEVAKQYGALSQGRARVQALEQAQESARQAVIGSEKGLQAGTRNVVDVLNAQQQLFSVRSDLADARHNLAMAYFRLRAVAGALTEADIVLANSWLEN